MELLSIYHPSFTIPRRIRCFPLSHLAPRLTTRYDGYGHRASCCVALLLPVYAALLGYQGLLQCRATEGFPVLGSVLPRHTRGKTRGPARKHVTATEEARSKGTKLQTPNPLMYLVGGMTSSSEPRSVRANSSRTGVIRISSKATRTDYLAPTASLIGSARRVSLFCLLFFVLGLASRRRAVFPDNPGTTMHVLAATYAAAVSLRRGWEGVVHPVGRTGRRISEPPSQSGMVGPVSKRHTLHGLAGTWQESAHFLPTSQPLQANRC